MVASSGAGQFVSEFFAEHRDLAQLGLRNVAEIMAPGSPDAIRDSRVILKSSTLLEAIRRFTTSERTASGSPPGLLHVIDAASGAVVGSLTPAILLGAVAEVIGGGGENE